MMGKNLQPKLLIFFYDSSRDLYFYNDSAHLSSTCADLDGGWGSKALPMENYKIFWIRA